MGAVSPPAGDFSEPVTSHTRRYVRSLWALDAKRAKARFFPAIHPLQSYSVDAGAMASWWHDCGCVRWEELRRRFLELLEDQARLERMARIIGKDAMPSRHRLILLCAELVNEAYLRQSAYSPIDRFASPNRQAAMMRLLGRFLDLAEEAVEAGVTPEKLASQEIYRRLLRMGEEIGEEQSERFVALGDQVEKTFTDLLEQAAESREKGAEGRE